MKSLSFLHMVFIENYYMQEKHPDAIILLKNNWSFRSCQLNKFFKAICLLTYVYIFLIYNTILFISGLKMVSELIQHQNPDLGLNHLHIMH